MLAPNQLTKDSWLPNQLNEKFQHWNVKYGAPYGRPLSGLVGRILGLLPQSNLERYRGAFSVQPNNTTRQYEYPWAFYAVPLKPGHKVLEIGGGLSGFQFVLDTIGCKVVNVDPGLEAKGVGWHCNNESINKMNRLFGTSVELRNCEISQADLPSNWFDCAYSISVLEHLPKEDVQNVMKYTFDCLKPGGYFVLTLDLFLDLAPFTNQEINRYGSNINVKWLTELAPFLIVEGNKAELNGFAEFDPDKIQSNLSSYWIGSYPTLIQCIVLQKPI